MSVTAETAALPIENSPAFYMTSFNHAKMNMLETDVGTKYPVSGKKSVETCSASSWRTALSPLHSIWKYNASVARPGNSVTRNSSFRVTTVAVETIIQSVPFSPSHHYVRRALIYQLFYSLDL